MAFIDKWSLFGGYLFYFIKEGLFNCGLYLQDGLHLEVVINTGLTVLEDVIEQKCHHFIMFPLSFHLIYLYNHLEV